MPISYLSVFPVQLAQEHEDLVLGTLHKNIKQQVLDERLHRWQLHDFPGYSLRGVALRSALFTRVVAYNVEGIVEHDVVSLVKVSHALLAAHELDLMG